MLTKAQARSLVRSHMTDAEKQVWSDSSLDVLIQTTIDEVWSELLDEAPWFRSQLDTVTSPNIICPGYIDLTLEGPLSKRFYRAQKVTRNSQEYGVMSPHNNVTYNGKDVSSFQFTYNVVGSQLWMFPLDASSFQSCPAEIRYSYLPTAFTTQTDDAAVDLVEGFETAFIYEIVVRLVDDQVRLNKFSTLASRAMDRLKSRVRREYVGPAVMNTTDYPIDLGGE